jgi:uncharacterized membrane protein YbhN (UPF0104 family)
VKWLATVLGVLLTAAMVASAFFELQPHAPWLLPRFSGAAFLAQLPRQWPWLLGFSLLSLAVLPLRALQWQSALRKRVSFSERYHVVAMGALVHNAVPGKLGDIFRALLLSRRHGMPFAEVLGSVVVCKLLELAALLALVALSFAGPFGRSLAPFEGGARWALMLCVCGLLGAWLLAVRAEPMAGWLESRDRAPRLRTLLRQVGAGFSAARSPRSFGRALGLSVGPVVAAALAYGVGLSGLGVPGGVAAGAVVLGAIALGQATPGMPVGLGLYYLVTSWAARALGAAAEDAALFAVLTHSATVLTQVAAGAVSLRVRRFRWAELRQQLGQVAGQGREGVPAPWGGGEDTWARNEKARQ